MGAKHYVSQSSIVGLEPGVYIGLILGRLGGVWNRLGLGSSIIGFGHGGHGLIVGGRKLVGDNLPLTLREQVIHHQWSPGLPIHRAVEDGHE